MSEAVRSKPINAKAPAPAVEAQALMGTPKEGGNSSSRTATFQQLFSQADSLDVTYMVLGTVGSMVTGVSLPIFNVLFGQMLDSLNKKGVDGYQVRGAAGEGRPLLS